MSTAAATMPKKKPVIVVVGTRPEAIKLVPIVHALDRSASYRPIVVSTGQHHDMVAETFELADVRIDAKLWIGDAHARLNERVAAVLRRFEDFCCGSFGDHEGLAATGQEILQGQYPVAVLVHGDTSSAFATALAAFHLRIPVLHVEAGLRVDGPNLTPFPEELNRRLIARIASFHLAPTATNQHNLVRENIPASQIFVSGNTGIDALQWAATLDVGFADPAVEAVVAGTDRVVVVTAHRRENWNGGLAGIAAGVAAVADGHPDVRFVVSMHPNPRVRAELAAPLEPLANVLLTESMHFASFSRLLARCELVITDSGGIQEEAPSLGKPVLVARESTERTEGLEAGTLRLVGCDPRRIAAHASELLEDPLAYRSMADAPNPYGDGHAAERIVAALEHLNGVGDPPVPFGPGYNRDAVLKASGYRTVLEVEQALRPAAAVEPVPAADAAWPSR